MLGKVYEAARRPALFLLAAALLLGIGYEVGTSRPTIACHQPQTSVEWARQYVGREGYGDVPVFVGEADDPTIQELIAQINAKFESWNVESIGYHDGLIIVSISGIGKVPVDGSLELWSWLMAYNEDTGEWAVVSVVLVDTVSRRVERAKVD